MLDWMLDGVVDCVRVKVKIQMIVDITIYFMCFQTGK